MKKSMGEKLAMKSSGVSGVSVVFWNLSRWLVVVAVVIATCKESLEPFSTRSVSSSMVVLASEPTTTNSHEPDPSDGKIPKPLSETTGHTASKGTTTNTKAIPKVVGIHDDSRHESSGHGEQQGRQQQQQHGQSQTNPADSCGIWVAKSTIPGSGMGMFAGRYFPVQERLGNTGDVVIPIIDMTLHQRRSDTSDWKFLWDEYTWDSVFLHIDHEGLEEVNVGSPGFGSAANSFLDLQNVDEWYAENDNLLDRRYDPGAGGFSAYHNRLSTARRDIQPGEELFVSYGDNWFLSRTYMGPVPVSGDLDRANEMFQGLKNIYLDHDIPDFILQEIWNSFVVNTNWTDSRVLGSFSKNNPDEELDNLLNKFDSLTDLRRHQATRDLQWIQEHGVCCDNMEVAQSTLVQAGRGAFSTRFIPKGSVMAPLPMIHIPYYYRLDMYALTKDGDGKTIIEKPRRATRQQLLVNYCYGHEESTILLCPYGMFVNSVNHNQTLANVRLQWADPERSSMNTSLLNQTIEYIDNHQKSAALAMEFVATRDIQAGEEIFLDYGDSWEEAWQQHLAEWKENSYKSPAAGQWNKDKESRLKTEFEQMTDPYPGDIELKCYVSFRDSRRQEWQPLVESGSWEALEKFAQEEGYSLASCELLRWREDGNNPGKFLYTALLTRLRDGGEVIGEERVELMKDVPREAFHFLDRPYSSDMFLPTAFRHPIMIPDDIFPEGWKNREHGADVVHPGDDESQHQPEESEGEQQ